jgi:rhodanese-related sulfurtransferase
MANVIVIDVRTEPEYRLEHIRGATNIDVRRPDFDQMIANFPKTARYLLYCRTGQRAALARRRMSVLGFPDNIDALGMAMAAKVTRLPTVLGTADRTPSNEPGRMSTVD